MPSRSHPFITGKAYHIYDKNLDAIRIFEDTICCEVFLQTLEFYRFEVPVSLSAYRRFKKSEQLLFRQTYMQENKALISIHVFVLMPNHYHLLVRQKKDGAIVRYMSNVINSITRYYNRRNMRKGPIFLPQFNSVAILGTHQLMYVSKYIHLNPLKAKLVKNFDELIKWKYSSLPMYLGYKPKYFWVKPTYVMKSFQYSKKMYRRYLRGDKY